MDMLGGCVKESVSRLSARALEMGCLLHVSHSAYGKRGRSHWPYKLYAALGTSVWKAHGKARLMTVVAASI